MSQLEVDKIIPQSGTTLTIGESGDTISFASGVLPSLESLTITGDLTVNTDTLYVDSTNNNVGIGTSSPSSLLHLIQTSDDTSGGLQIRNSANSNSIFIYQDGTTTTFDSGSSGDQAFKLGDAERMRIDSNGNVGIGTTSTDELLDVAGNMQVRGSSGSARIYLRDVSSGLPRDNYIGMDSYDNLLLAADDGNVGSGSYMGFKVDGSEAMRIDSSGNVGIGTTNPATALEVIGSINSSDGGTQGILINPSGSIEIANTDGGALIDFKTSTSEDRDARIRQVSNGLSFETGGNGSVSEAMRIDSSGNVGIGATSPSEKLQVNGDVRLASSGSNILFGNPPGSGSGTGPYGFRFDDDSATSYDLYFRTSPNELSWEVNGADKVQIQSDGDIFNTNGTYGTISDQKLKQQITDASSQWEDIKNIRVRKYKLNQQVEELGDSDDLWRLGVVAQELELTSPALVNTKPDYSKETGEDLGTTTKTVKMSILYMKAVKALQEAMARIESLETENTDIKARLETLENE